MTPNSFTIEPNIIVPIANSAGFAIAQIGAVFAYAMETRKRGVLVNISLYADERFVGLVDNSAWDMGSHIRVARPYKRQAFPPSALITVEQNKFVAQVAPAEGRKILAAAQLAERLKKYDNEKYALTDSPAGFLLANPVTWIRTDSMVANIAEKAEWAKTALDAEAEKARELTGKPNADVVFLFFVGDKLLTDSEPTFDAKRLGGLVKSVGADDQIAAIAALQKEAGDRGQLIVPVFAQHGDKQELQARMDTFNKSGNLITPVTNLGADWNTFEEPAYLMSAANKHYRGIVIGNGSAIHHLTTATTADPDFPILILRPAWADIPGESHWDKAEKNNRVILFKADEPRAYSYRDMMNMVKTKPGIGAKLIRQSSESVIQKGYNWLSQIYLPNIPTRNPIDFPETESRHER